MQTSVRNEVELSLLDRQREIQSRCYHPQGSFEPFERADIEQSVSARFEQQVEKYPDRLAVKTDERELTYAQLNRIANHIAHSILAECYDSTAPVVLFLEHGIPMVCGILAVLKAGKSYVPLDPLYPRARNAYMLSDSQAGLMVTDTVNLGYATELTQYRVPLVNVDEIETKEPAEDLGLPVSPDQVAYILYTSGSTGQPKGVYQNHRNLLHYLAHFTNTLHICRHDRIALLYSFNVNGHLRGTFGALLNGAALFTYDIKAKGLTGLADWLQREEITVYHSVPTVFRHLMDTLKGDERFPHVRLIRLGGEPVPARNVALYKRHFPAPCILYTALGSTETSTIRHYFTDHESEMAASAVPTGFAVEERETILLDDQEQEVGIGEVGQIAVKSRYLALGYWGKPELTQKAFRPAPDDDRARIYLTGDLGRILPDGRMIYMGRKDAQVKVRGFRVETVGIEATLLQHPRIKEAAVITWPDGLGDNYLAAYTVPYQDDPPTTRELHEFVRERLPDYMVPAAFVSLKTMPLTPNSKVNRRALPRPEKLRPELGTEYVAPHRPVEQALAEMWSEVLDIEQIGVEDNFFHLGGHSLRAAQIVSRIRDRFGIELPLRIIFEAPTVGSMADLVIQNQAEKQTSRSIKPVCRGQEGLPLSFAQQRLWFLDQLEPGSSAYNIVATHRLIGPLDVVALEQGFNEVVRRHESLRTTVSVIDNEPRQIVAPAISIPLAVVDLGGLPMAEQEVEAQRVINQIGHQPFDLTRGPLIRTTLLRLRHTEHILIVTVHHMVSDAWSMNILFRELSHFYASFCRGESSSLPELAVQYGDFAVWQREWLQGQVLEAQLAYWRQHLKDSPAVLTLPADYPRPPVQTFRGELQSLQLPSKLCESLQALSRQENTTLFMVLLTAFKLLVYRYTRQEGVVIGIPVAGRNHTEVEGLIGFFISTLVLYTPFTDQDTFRELLAREREIELGAYDHQDIPFEKLVEELQPERSLSHTPLFQIFFNMTSAERHRLELEGLTVEPIPPAEPESKFDMTLYVNHVGGEIRSRLVYNADLFSAERMAELLAQYEQLLSQVVENPDLKSTEFSLVTQRSSSLLPDPQETLPEPRYDLLTERFADWAQRTPDRLAISQNSRTWSYAELASSARELARVLLTQGLKRGDVIAVAGPSSFGLVASTLGAFLSGGVLLTLDENLPGERRRLMLQEARAKYLLSVGARSVEAEGPAQGLTVLEVAPDTGCVSDTRCRRQPARDTEPTLSARWPTREPGRLDVTSLPELSPEDAAYIFFTSGTTGVPKAILGCHKGLAHFLTWQRETFEIGPQDKGAQLAGLSFDAVLRDIFTPLTSGATLCLPEPGMGPDPARILPWLDREEVSLLHVVPSLVESWLLDLPDGVSLKSMRWVFFSGEPLTDSLVRRWRAAFPRAGEIVNLYGPTETTMIKCYYHVPADPPAGVQPAGRPQPETQALVLTRDNQRCGVGEPGEIVIRTPFRTLGYLNAAAENRRAFVPNPFRDDPLDLVYRTGDRGRYRSDGLLEILGRLDDQVKIRGVRIEPGEIAAVLRQHSEVGQAVVVACQDGPGDTRLVAYVVPVQGQSLIGGELRAFLRPKLPDPMIPSAFVFLERLPLTPNGKVDRRALPEPSGVVLDADQGHPLETPFAAPRTRAEETVADIWAHVLGRERIGIHDNFFDLGGHSLLATRIVSRLRAAFQVDLPLRKLFELPTVSGLAQYVETLHRLVQPAQNLFEESRDDREVIVI